MQHCFEVNAIMSSQAEYGVIYKITSLIDGKVYIGQTRSSFHRRYDAGGKGIERVYRYYKNCIRNGRSYNRHLMSAIEKYGFDNFVIDERFDIAYSSEELDSKERYWISHFKSTDERFGYNYENGGNPGKDVPESTRLRQSLSQRRRFSKPKNKKYMYERHHSEETKMKISASKKGKHGHPMPPGNLEKLNQSKRKSVICITTGEKFYYMKDAMTKYGIKSQGSLSLACHGKRNYCGQLEDGTKLKWTMGDD